MESRNQYFDFLRGIAIIMVVGIHAFPEAMLRLDREMIAVAVRQICNCAVPLFYAISGFFLSRKKLDTFCEITEFYKKQIPKVYIPTLIWSMPYLIIRLINGSHHAVLYILVALCCGLSIYYFIGEIVEFYLFLPLLKKMNNGGGIVSVLISTILIFFARYYYSPDVSGQKRA